MKGLVKALLHLSEFQILHRDLKLDNILFKKKGLVTHENVILADFGLATFYNVKKFMYYKCGTPGFIAPEILNCNEHEKYGLPCDVFSLGVIFHYLLFGESLFNGKSFDEVIFLNKNCNLSPWDSKYKDFKN
jgi:serine/threonine protein kinase